METISTEALLKAMERFGITLSDEHIKTLKETTDENRITVLTEIMKTRAVHSEEESTK